MSKQLRARTKKVNIRLWLEDIEFAESIGCLFPGMSTHAVLRQLVTTGREQWQAEQGQKKDLLEKAAASRPAVIK